MAYPCNVTMQIAYRNIYTIIRKNFAVTKFSDGYAYLKIVYSKKIICINFIYNT